MDDYLTGAEYVSKQLELAGEKVSEQLQKKSKSSAKFDSPVSALDLGFKRGFFLKHLFSSWPKRLQKLHWDTLQVACL